MSANSAIEWTDATWNPIRARNLKTGKIGWRCEHATTGCEFCYAEGFNKRLGTGLPFKPGHRPDIEIFLDAGMLTLPLRWKKPRMIFVCSMTDLFADFVKDEWIDQMFAVMALCPQHTFQVLTKRAERMREYFTNNRVGGDPPDAGWLPGARASWGIREALTRLNLEGLTIRDAQWDLAWADDRIGLPLPNVWLGVSAERQQEADERVPHLLNTPAAVRFVSAEPLLGPINFEPWLAWGDDPYKEVNGKSWGCQECDTDCRDCPDGKAVYLCTEGPTDADGAPAWVKEDRQLIDWIIVGGESGSKARPMRPQWACDIRDQCHAAGVKFFFKQWGEWAPGDGDCLGQQSYRVGKKAAGRMLDGVEHNGLPTKEASL